MRRYSPKTQLLFYGWAMLVVALIWAGLALFLLPIYIKLKHGQGAVRREDFVAVLNDILWIAAAMAVFLGFCARSVFRNRKRLKDD